VSPETLDTQVQQWAPNKFVKRVKEQEDYKVKALHDHTRRNFEDNEKVTMFVGSIDIRRRRQKSQDEGERTSLKRKYELQHQKDFLRMQQRSQGEM